MILFFSDLHVHHTHRFSHITPEGRTVREQEHLMCADKIVELIDKYNISRVIFGGDMFGPVGDNLSTQCLDTVCEFIEKIQNKCIEKGIDFDILVGNHDISGHLNNQYTHKLIPFKKWQNVNVYDQPSEKNNIVYMPFCISDDFATDYLNSVNNKADKIVVSHLELKDVNLGNGIFTQKGVSINLLDKFKIVLQGHYHSGTTCGSNIFISGSTQRLSFKDQGKSRDNILIYNEKTGEIFRESFDCPDWLCFNDDNIEDILKISDDNYVKVDVTTDILLTDKIKDKINRMKNKDVHVDLTRIKVNRKVEESIQSENEVDVIKQFVDKSDNDDEQKVELLQVGIDLINRVKK